MFVGCRSELVVDAGRLLGGDEWPLQFQLPLDGA